MVQDDVHGEGKKQDICSLSDLMVPTSHELERKAAVNADGKNFEKK